eukprot:6214334-Pleurochrysis_carterae.AAC.4
MDLSLFATLLDVLERRRSLSQACRLSASCASSAFSARPSARLDSPGARMHTSTHAPKHITTPAQAHDPARAPKVSTIASPYTRCRMCRRLRVPLKPWTAEPRLSHFSLIKVIPQCTVLSTVH